MISLALFAVVPSNNTLTLFKWNLNVCFGTNRVIAEKKLTILETLLSKMLGLDVFHERVKVFQNWQHSQLMLTKKREQKAKLDLAHKTTTGAGSVTTEIVEWEAKVERCEEEFNNISKMIKKEMDRFEIERVKDFKAVILKYLEEQMCHQQQLIKYWEAFLPEAKAIA